MRNKATLSLLVPFLVLTLVSCEVGEDASMDRPTGSGVEDAWMGDVSGHDFVEQPEIAYNFLAPKASRDYVFVANETLDTVSKIDADSLEITSIPVGDRPTQLEAVEHLNLAVVLNQDSDELSIIRADVLDENTDIVDEVSFLDIDERTNTLVLSPDGRFAFAFFSYASHEDGEPVGNFQTVSLVRTDRGDEAFFSLSVGFQVRSIVFRSSSPLGGIPVTSHAYVVTDTGISIIELDEVDADRVLPVIPVSPRTLDDPLDREVYVTPSGEYAVVRDQGFPEFYIVELATAEITTIDLEFSATDIDLFPSDGTPAVEEDRALLTVREANQVLDFHVDEAFHDGASALRALDAGESTKGLASIGPNGRYVLLYTTLGGEQMLTIVDIASHEASLQELVMRKPLSGAAISPDGQYAIVAHPRQTDIPDTMPSADQLVAAEPGYSIVELSTGFTRLVVSEVPVEDFTFWTGDLGSFAYLSFNDETQGVAYVDRIALDTFSISPLELGSQPADIGKVTGRGRIWVNQEHPVGRMTFIDVESGTPMTVTGFELNRFVH